MIQKQNIIFYSNEENEYINNIVYRCDSEIISETDNFIIIKKYNLIKINTEINTEYINDKNIFIIITYYKEKDYNKFLRGYIYFENKEYEIGYYCRFGSKQIKEYCYDNIGICYLSKNIFV